MTTTLWYKQDTAFQKPKIRADFTLLTARADATARSAALSSLFAALVRFAPPRRRLIEASVAHSAAALSHHTRFRDRGWIDLKLCVSVSDVRTGA